MNLNRSHILNQKSRNRAGWWARLGRFIGMSEEPAQPEPHLITVWDARREQYRHVNLLNTHDPLWATARALAVLRSN